MVELFLLLKQKGGSRTFNAITIDIAMSLYHINVISLLFVEPLIIIQG